MTPPKSGVLNEELDWIGAAEKLLRDSRGTQQKDLGYRAYLRQVITKHDPGYLTKSSDPNIKAGALEARKDLVDLASSLPPV